MIIIIGQTCDSVIIIIDPTCDIVIIILAPSCDAVTRIDYECPLPSSGEQQDSVKPFCNGFIGYHEYLIILCDKAIMGLIN